jgi:hypothetical protein
MQEALHRAGFIPPGRAGGGALAWALAGDGMPLNKALCPALLHTGAG